MLEPCTDKKFSPLMKLPAVNSSITLEKCQENSSGRKKRCYVIMIIHYNSYRWLIGHLGSSAVSLTLPNTYKQTNKQTKLTTGGYFMPSCKRKAPGGAKKFIIQVLCQDVAGRHMKEVTNLLHPCGAVHTMKYKGFLTEQMWSFLYY